MKLIVVGLNHKTAPVEIRERFNFHATVLSIFSVSCGIPMILPSRSSFPPATGRNSI